MMARLMGRLARSAWLGRVVRANLANPPDWLVDLLGAGTRSAAGIEVTQESARAYIPVFAAIRVLAESVAMLPLVVVERLADGGKRRATEHWLYPLLHDAPNPEMTSFEWRETAQEHLGGWGNAYSQIQYNGAGRVIALWPLRPDRMQVGRAGDGLQYVYQTASGEDRLLGPSEVLHVRGMGGNGIVGYSPIQVARQAIGLGLAAETFGATFFGNGARPGLVLEHPGKLSSDAYNRLKEGWEERHAGAGKAHRTAILEEGMKLHEIGIPPEDAQFIATRTFQITEIARLYRIPPSKLMEYSNSGVRANAEQQAIELLTDTLLPWLTRWEQRLSASLLAPQERGRFSVKFVIDGVLRADTQTRYAAYAVGRQWGWLSVNDIRQREDMNPVPGGDEYMVPLNMAPAALAEGDPDAAQRAAVMGEGRREQTTLMARQVRAASSRRRLAQSYRRTLRHVAQRITNREVNDIRNAARKYLTPGASATGFEVWLRNFDGEHAAFVREYLDAPMRTYAELVAAEVERETGRDVAADEMGSFVRDYVEGRANQWMANLMRGVQAALHPQENRAENDAGGDALGGVEGFLDERQAAQPDAFADEESTRASNAMAVWLYILIGILRKVWRAFGENCPYCGHMNGTTVGVEEHFLQPDDQINLPGGAFKTNHTVGHPPLHTGCDCMVVAG